jgi:ribosome maturation factor RimP
MPMGHEIREELEAIAERCGCVLLNATYEGGLLRLILDRDGGVTITECSNVSREVSAFLDVVDFGKGRYTLEVSSPGLDRKFYSESDYQRFQGERVKISWLEESRKKTATAKLKKYQPNPGATPQIELEFDEGVRTIPLDRVVETRLEPNF